MFYKKFFVCTKSKTESGKIKTDEIRITITIATSYRTFAVFGEKSKVYNPLLLN